MNATNDIFGDRYFADSVGGAGCDPSDLSTWTMPRQNPDDVAALDVRIGHGAGYTWSPFCCTREQLTDTCENFGFSKEFLTRLSEKRTFLEHQFTFAAANEDGEEQRQPTHLQIAAADVGINFFMCLIRYELGHGGATERAKCIIFIRPYESRKLLQPIGDITARFEREKRVLSRHPLLVLNVLLGLLQEDRHNYEGWVYNLNKIEAELGVSYDPAYFKKMGYPDVSYDFGRLNVDLAICVRALADEERDVTTMRDHAIELQRLSDLCYAIERPSGGPQEIARFDERHELIQSTICRADLFSRHLNMAKDRLQALTAVLFNRIDNNESRSMKTIAVVTLLFLPATFVATVFSTGIFNFQAGEPADAPRVVSSYGWVYLLVSLLTTVLAILSWTCWYFWGGPWLDKLRHQKLSGEFDAFATLKIWIASGRNRLPFIGRRKTSNGYP